MTWETKAKLAVDFQIGGTPGGLETNIWKGRQQQKEEDSKDVVRKAWKNCQNKEEVKAYETEKDNVDKIVKVAYKAVSRERARTGWSGVFGQQTAGSGTTRPDKKSISTKRCTESSGLSPKQWNSDCGAKDGQKMMDDQVQILQPRCWPQFSSWTRTQA